MTRTHSRGCRQQKGSGKTRRNCFAGAGTVDVDERLGDTEDRTARLSTSPRDKANRKVVTLLAGRQTERKYSPPTSHYCTPPRLPGERSCDTGSMETKGHI